MKYIYETLLLLIEQSYFANSPTHFARLLGYQGGQQFVNMLHNRQQPREKTLREIWGKMQWLLGVKSEDLFRSAHEVVAIRDQIREIWRLWKGREMEDNFRFVEVLASGCDARQQTKEFNQVLGELKEWRRMSAQSYFEALAWFYFAELKGIRIYTKGGFVEFFTELKELNAYLERRMGKSLLAENLLVMAEQTEAQSPVNWFLVASMGGVLLLHYFEQQEFEHLQKSGSFFNLGELTWWRDASAELREGSSVYLMIESLMEGGVVENAVYELVEFCVDYTNPALPLRPLCLRLMIFEMHNDMLIYQKLMADGTRELVSCHWEKEDVGFRFSPTELGVKIDLPESLKRIRLDGKDGDETTWRRMIQSMNEVEIATDFENFCQRREEVKDECVVDVILSRQNISIVTNGMEHDVPKVYTFRLKDIMGWNRLSPKEDVELIYRKNLETGEREKMVWFPRLTFEIPISLAEKKMTEAEVLALLVLTNASRR